MSRLSDKMEKAMEGKVQPMGFATHAAWSAVRPLLVVGRLPKSDPALAELAVSEKVDVCLFLQDQVEKGKEAFDATLKAMGEVPWGVALTEASPELVDQLQQEGCDFLVVTPDAIAAPLLRERKEMSVILQVDVEMSDAMLQAAGGLPLDAILISGWSPLTLRRWMELHRLCGMSGQPLFLPAPKPATKEELEALWEAGVRGVVVDMGEPESREHLIQIAKALESVETSPKKAKERRTALLPAFGGGWAAAEDGEEEEDE